VVNLRRLDAGPGLRAAGDQAVPLDDQLAEMIALREEGKIGAIGLSSVTLDILRRALPAGIVCVQNAYSLVAREDEDMLALCAAENIAWVPYFPLGGAIPGMPKVTDEPAARRGGCARVHPFADQLGLAAAPRSEHPPDPRDRDLGALGGEPCRGRDHTGPHHDHRTRCRIHSPCGSAGLSAAMTCRCLEVSAGQSGGGRVDCGDRGRGQPK
jgi:hypothetical protein